MTEKTDETKKAKAEAKADEKAKIEAEKRQQKIPGTEPADPPPEPKKRGPGRPRKTEGETKAPTKKRKPPETIEDTDKALRRWYRDGQKLVTRHKKKHPEAKVAAVDPFSVDREKLKLEKGEAKALAHFSFKTLGGFLRVPSAVPPDDRLDLIGDAWDRALPYMQIDAGRFYVAVAGVLTGAAVLSMLVLAGARLLGKYQDPAIDQVESQIAGMLGGADTAALDQIERQLDAQIEAEKAAIAARRAELTKNPNPLEKKDGKK